MRQPGGGRKDLQDPSHAQGSDRRGSHRRASKENPAPRQRQTPHGRPGPGLTQTGVFRGGTDSPEPSSRTSRSCRAGHECTEQLGRAPGSRRSRETSPAPRGPGPALLPGKPLNLPAAPAAFRAERGTLLIPASSSFSRALCFSHLIRTYPPPVVTFISILPTPKHVLVPPVLLDAEVLI